MELLSDLTEKKTQKRQEEEGEETEKQTEDEKNKRDSVLHSQICQLRVGRENTAEEVPEETVIHSIKSCYTCCLLINLLFFTADITAFGLHVVNPCVSRKKMFKLDAEEMVTTF